MSDDGFSGSEFGFAAGSVFGIRRWWLGVDGVLNGVYAPWKAGVNEAACMKFREVSFPARYFGATVRWAVCDGEEHLAPDEDCNCGFWAYWNPDGGGQPQFSSNPFAVHVAGVVEGFGRMLQGEKGFRCSRARIAGVSVLRGPYYTASATHGFEMGGYRDLPSDLLAGYRAQIETRYKVPSYSTGADLLAAHPLSDPAELGLRPTPTPR